MKKYGWLLIAALLLTGSYYVKSHQKNMILSGITIVLDAGHGLPDMGASAYEIDEAPLNLSLTMKLKSTLENMGCDVVLTRSDENDLAGNTASSRKKKDMERRMQIINDEKNDFFISIHINKFENEDVKGLHVFYDAAKSFSMDLASSIQNAANQNLKQDKQIKKGDFYLLNHSRISGVLIECGFLSNAAERENLLSDSYQNTLVHAIAEGVVACVDHRFPSMI